MKIKFKDYMNEMKVMFGGYNLKDNILDDITVEELQDTIYSNVPNEKINKNTIKKEFEALLRMKLNNARVVFKKILSDLEKELKDNS